MNKKYNMSDKIKYIIDEGLYNFYKEADSEIIKELLKNDVSNLEDYEKRKRKLIFLAQAKAKLKISRDKQRKSIVGIDTTLK